MVQNKIYHKPQNNLTKLDADFLTIKKVSKYFFLIKLIQLNLKIIIISQLLHPFYLIKIKSEKKPHFN